MLCCCCCFFFFCEGVFVCFCFHSHCKVPVNSTPLHDCPSLFCFWDQGSAFWSPFLYATICLHVIQWGHNLYKIKYNVFTFPFFFSFFLFFSFHFFSFFLFFPPYLKYIQTRIHIAPYKISAPFTTTTNKIHTTLDDATSVPEANIQNYLNCPLDITLKLRYTSLRLLCCVHSLLQRSCVTDLSITYLPQLNATYTNVLHLRLKLTFAAVPHCIVGAETVIRSLQRTATHWTLNATWTLHYGTAHNEQQKSIAAKNKTYLYNYYWWIFSEKS